MVSQLLIDQKVAKGYAKAAQRTGSATTVFRPASPMAPLAQPPFMSGLMAAFSKEVSLTFQSSIPWDGPLITGMFDPTGLDIGDILQNPVTAVDGDPLTSTYFIVRRDPFRPPIVVLTTNLVSFYDTSQPGEWGTVGVRPPSGPSKAQDVLIASEWPVAIVLSVRGMAAQAKLPTDTRRGSYKLLCPAIPGADIWSGKRVLLENGQPLRVEGAHASQYGWHFECVADSA